MGLIGVGEVAIQVALFIHALRWERDSIWLFVILLPVIGPLAYITVSVLPERFSQKSAARPLKSYPDPYREYRERLKAQDHTTPQAERVKLAEDCLAAELTQEAVQLYDDLVDEFPDDPFVLVGLATALNADGQSRPALAALVQAQQAHGNAPNAAVELLRARILEQLQQPEDAVHAFQLAVRFGSGEEARVRFGLFLQAQGEIERAKVLFRETLHKAKVNPRFYRKQEKTWIDIAARQLASLEG